MTEAGIADEEDSSAETSESDQSEGNAQLQSRFFTNNGGRQSDIGEEDGIQEAADADEMDEPREQ